ncbi:cannabinoid receptor 2 [Protobothrops mucrosquamatus]|uniref:cannabinoid receptor 2 n=1 Tax=Protobothrops mucrosquamatus TaxID=103944 RepID=UPI0007757C83|nr:cannabinoid receptor 2 [Protobothrops mucrosquamatus]
MEGCDPAEIFTNFQCNSTLLHLKCFMVLNKSEKPIIAVLCLSIGGLCIVENSLVLYLIFSSSKLRKKPSYILLSSLALADTLATITFVSSFLNFHVFNRKSASKEIYLLKLTGVNTSFTASLGSLFLMAFDRYICLLQPSQYKQLVTRRRAVVALSVLWVTALFLSSLPLLGWNCCSLQSTCSQLFPFVANSYLSSWIILVLVLLVSIIYAYMHVLWKAHQHTLNMKKHHLEESQQNPKRRIDIKLAKTLSIVLMVLVICWSPGLLLMAYSLFSTMDKFARVAFAFCITLCLVNSMVNPAIYALRSKELSSSLRRLCSCLRKVLANSETNQEAESS